MKIGLVHQNNHYGFVILAKQNSKAIFNSFRDHLIIPYLKHGYPYAWQAQKAANRFLKNHSYHLKYAREDLTKPIITDVSAEEMLENHYMAIYDGIEDKTHGIKNESEEDKEMVYQELKMIRDELETIIEQLEDKRDKVKMKRILMLYKQLIRRNFRKEDEDAKKKEKENPQLPMPAQPPQPAPQGGMPPLMASVLNDSDNIRGIDKDTKKELIEHYGEKACEAIQRKHPSSHYIIYGDNDEIIIFDEDNTPILGIGINKQLQLNRIIPMGKIRKFYPYHSVDFYQKYWKPIVEEIGHIYINDASTIILPKASPLPDTPKGNEVSLIEGWNVKDKKPRVLEVSFKGEKPCWFFDAAKVEKIASSSSKYTEQDYINSIVKCIDPKLDSIFGRTGSVIQVIPNNDFIEVDVDFGRGLDIVRLTEKQLEIIPI